MVDNQNRTDSNPAVIWFPHVTVTPCSVDVVCRLRVCPHLVLELFVSIVEIQTHVQQLVVQKHISYNSIFNCSNGSPLWDPWNVSVSMNLTVSITCKVSRVRVIHGTHLASGNIGPENCMRFKYVCIIIDNASFVFLHLTNSI